MYICKKIRDFNVAEIHKICSGKQRNTMSIKLNILSEEDKKRKEKKN